MDGVIGKGYDRPEATDFHNEELSMYNIVSNAKHSNAAPLPLLMYFQT